MRQERVPVSQVLLAEPLVDLPEDTENRSYIVRDIKPRRWQGSFSAGEAEMLPNNKQK